MKLITKKNEYKKLKFFCDWSLHYKIDDTDSMIKEIENFIDGKISSIEFFNYFHDDLRIFLKEYDILTNIYENMKNRSKFNYLLAEIFRDSPLIIRYVKKRKLTITEVRREEIEIGGTKAYSVSMTMTFTDEKP